MSDESESAAEGDRPAPSRAKGKTTRKATMRKATARKATARKVAPRKHRVRGASKAPRASDGRKPERPFPRVTLEEALRVAIAIKEKNAGNPYSPEDIAKVLKVGAKGGQYWYLTAGARDYGLTIGTRDSEKIALTELGRSAVFPSSPVEGLTAKRTAFLTVDLFRRVLEHYKGSTLPEMEYLSNTLTKEFGLDPLVHEEFVRNFQKNCEFLDIRDWSADQRSVGLDRTESGGGPAVITIGQSKQATGLLCFVIMPFTERDERHSPGFFGEVIQSLIVPAATEAGFTVRSARRQGSDVIQQTIVSDLLQADLVVADLTEHNPNVMFELGMRMAHDKPVALIRAKGTGGIFDVDNMLRVYDYDPDLWPSTIARDLPAIKDHIGATWENRESDVTYMKLLGRALTS
jgi:hypothetical protein